MDWTDAGTERFIQVQTADNDLWLMILTGDELVGPLNWGMKRTFTRSPVRLKLSDLWPPLTIWNTGFFCRHAADSLSCEDPQWKHMTASELWGELDHLCLQHDPRVCCLKAFTLQINTNKPEIRRGGSYIPRQNKVNMLALVGGFYLNKSRLAVSVSLIKEGNKPKSYS